MLAAAAGLWWFRGIEVGSGLAIGAASAWAWRPCVGAELASALNLAQQDPLAALPGLAAFMIGVVIVGLGIGWAVSLMLRRFDLTVPRRAGAVVIGALGLVMVFGLYGTLYSELARWSSSIWG